MALVLWLFTNIAPNPSDGQTALPVVLNSLSRKTVRTAIIGFNATELDR